MKINWLGSLRTKIIAWSFVPTVIILSTVAWFTFFSYQKVYGDLAIEQYPVTVEPKSQAFYSAFAGLYNPTVVSIYLDVDTDHKLPFEERAQKILEQGQGLDRFDGGIYFLDPHGKVIRTQPEQPELIGQDWSNTPHFRSINATPNMSATTDLMTLQPSGKKIFCSATALAGETWKDVVGAVYCCFTIYPVANNAFYQAINSLDLGSNVYIVDRNQQIVYSPDPAKMGKDLSGEAYMQQLSQGKKRSGRFRIGTQDMVVSYVPVVNAPTDRWGWYVVTEQSWYETMRPTLPYRQLLLVLLALGIIVPVLVTAYGVRHVTQPIQKLIQATEQVTAGQFKHRIEVKTGDEIETLANQFNVMSAELDESYSSLEKKVTDRTRELAIMNSILSVANRSLDIQDILQDALEITVEQMGYEAGAAYKIDLESNLPLLVTQQCFEPAVALDLASQYAITPPGNAVEWPSAVTIHAVEDTPGQLLPSNIRFLVSVPLSTKGRTLGLFLLGKYPPGELSTEELSLLTAIGQQVGVAMENAHLYEQAEQAAIAAERHRLAREFHDAVTQTLFSANLIADVIPRVWKRSPEEGLQNLEELRQLTRGALAEMRTMLLEMRPESLERSDLKSLLTQLSDAFTGRVRVPISLVIQGDCEPTRDVKLVFYRVAQEALNNIAKHSGARQVELHLDARPGKLNLEIKDDGLGFDPASVDSGHLGIAIMRERASSIGASFKIESQQGQGTIVELDWRPARED